MAVETHLDITPLKPEDIPDPNSAEFQQFLDTHFAAGEKLAESMDSWEKHSTRVDGTVQVVNLKNSSHCHETRKTLGIKDYWCGRSSHHTAESVNEFTRPKTHHTSSYDPRQLVRSISHHFGRRSIDHTNHVADTKNGTEAENDIERRESEVERQARVMKQPPHGLYERFRRGLLEYHSENEREYIESCRETHCLQVFQPHVAEVWKLTYVTPPPTSPRTFVVLLLSRELRTEPTGERCFMNISIPFNHPDCPEKKGDEKSRVRGRYVSVERVRELDGGQRVEWRMATSSDAGGNIPRFVTNSSLPSSISEDVPSFLKWMAKRFPEGGPVETHPVA
ncbi:hypothetical protein BCR39DRAFT_592329 [Naematelia encephala]|uniref:DUF3074 domain-containing protein n=1 Tax=Naematelia encephala TaxID=71784 RepID=A0A1Y2BJ72_9TREE|nr:hypothetical protein BCR39DRAFT_592329 [Naematelia encephala]